MYDIQIHLILYLKLISDIPFISIINRSVITYKDELSAEQL